MIFDKRINLKPYEYPDLIKYVEAIRGTYWTPEEYSYTSDIQDFHNMSDNERKVFMKTMLAISQIEVAVKTFWGDIHRYIPKPEVAKVWATFSFNETIHEDLYSHIIELLWLNKEFEKILDIEPLRKRIELVNKWMRYKDDDRKWFLKSLIFFSLYIENVSLFSQFYIAMSYNKFKGYMKGMSNGIESSTKEEVIHATFWIELVNIIREEYPNLITQEDIDEITNLFIDIINNELDILSWIFEDWDLDFVGKYTVSNYIYKRMTEAFNKVGIDFDIRYDTDEIEKTKWFDEEISITKHTDFFNKRSINYTKKDKSFTSNDLF